MYYTFNSPSTAFIKSLGLKVYKNNNNYVCSHCLKNRMNLKNGERSSSTYSSALKLLLKRKKNLKVKYNEDQALSKLVEDYGTSATDRSKLDIHHLDALLGGKKKRTIQLLNQYTCYDSTKSYDPSLMMPDAHVQLLENIQIGDVNAESKPAVDSDTNMKSYSLQKDGKPNILSTLSEKSILSPNINIDFEENQPSKPQLQLQNQKTHLKNSLYSYIDVALFIGMKNFALETVANSREREGWKHMCKEKGMLDMYNQLLLAYSDEWATNCCIQHWMLSDRIKFNYQTYSIILYSLGRNKDENKTFKSDVCKLIQLVSKMPHSLTGLFTHTRLSREQYSTIHQTIREVLPYFELAPAKIDLNSPCNLLKDLYKKRVKVGSQISCPTLKCDFDDLIQEQLNMEEKFFVEVEAININNFYLESTMAKRTVNKLKTNWREQLQKSFLDTLKVLETEHNASKLGAKANLYLYLRCLPPEEYVDTLMKTVGKLLEYSNGFTPSMSSLTRNLGEEIYQRYVVHKKRRFGIIENTKTFFRSFCDWYVDPSGPARNSRQQWQMLLQEKSFNRIDLREIHWPDKIKSNVGKLLYNIILNEVKITTKQGNHKSGSLPVFYCVLRRHKNHPTEQVKCHPIISKLIHKCGFETIHFASKEMPMVCPPKPWNSITQGGYLISSPEFIRKPNFVGGKLDVRNIPEQQFYATFDALNSLQKVPWRINEPVLDVILEVFQNGGSNELKVPEYPETEPVELHITPQMNISERMQEFQRKKKILLERQNQYGLWCEALYRLSLANHFRNRIFWLPQNLDFRGRVYPVPPHLNHMGCDLFRCLLKFAEGRPLGPRGLDWLKIHLINLTGSKKQSSNQERLDYANDILPEIMDSAERPLTGNRWWNNSDDPWQTLATSMEIKKALECDNPENYICYFPVHQDGSCNGLQHYAALGRDQLGAESVNLTPGSSPQDVYSSVTQVIERMRRKDAMNGVKIAQILEGYVSRKVVKQTIMTTVYGVTHYGAREQINRQLEDIPGFPKEHIWSATKYLTEKTFLSLRKMFSAARQIQDWFTKCATEISNQEDYVKWISPIGLPVVQPYGKLVKEKGKEVLKPHKVKQRNSFPPNFVHSLDSTHMMLTSLFCEQENITYAAIHDCYWTHPCSVNVMNVICRDQFVSLYSQSILQDLSSFFLDAYPNMSNKVESNAFKAFKKVPKTGDFNINSVRESAYFFS